MHSLNVRGLQGKDKRALVFEWLKKYNSSIIFLQETHTSKLDETKWEKEWGSDIYFSNGETNARGVCTLVPKSLALNTKIFYKDMDGRILIVELELSDTQYYLINIYAPTTASVNAQIDFLKLLNDQLLLLKDCNIIAGGDWNIVLDQKLDKKGGNNTDNKSKKYRDSLEVLMEEYQLSDVWRIYHPNKKRYTWHRHKPMIMCRLDRWLTSCNLLNIVCSCKISPGFRTDHSLITLVFKASHFKRGKGIWKFNNELLRDKEYVTYTKSLISNEIDSMATTEDKGLVWDYIKMRIRTDTMEYTGRKNKIKREQQKNLEDNLSKLSSDYDINPSDDLEMEISTVRQELEMMVRGKLNSSIFRSKCDWTEHGEKNTKFFLNLEKYNYTNKHIQRLEVEDKMIDKEKDILKELQTFYEELYADKPTNMEMQ